MDALQTAFLAKLRRLLPLRPPTTGWLYTLQRMEAAVLGGSMSSQSILAKQMTGLGCHLLRSDASPTVWSGSAYSWVWSKEAEAGAEGPYLDHWGMVYGIPRCTGEADDRYSLRILAELTGPTATNIGMAQAIDAGTSRTGTQVVDAPTFYAAFRLNNGRRANSGIRSNMFPDPIGRYPWGSFVVVWTSPITSSDRSMAEGIVSRGHSAGTRLLGIYYFAESQGT